ncbi:MAG: hypothetical protein JSR82_13810 [Verrucomicrobia bacterium]|nr:hypothetical protein [Verrucomicrobiota bacterium]
MTKFIYLFVCLLALVPSTFAAFVVLHAIPAAERQAAEQGKDQTTYSYRFYRVGMARLHFGIHRRPWAALLVVLGVAFWIAGTFFLLSGPLD